MAGKRAKKAQLDESSKAFNKGVQLLNANALFKPMLDHAHIYRNMHQRYPTGRWAMVTNNGDIYINPKIRAKPAQWVYIIAHCLLHLGFDHFQEHDNFNVWNLACDCFIARFLDNLKVGSAPSEMIGNLQFSAGSEDALYNALSNQAVPAELKGFSVAGAGQADMILDPVRTDYHGKKIDWQKLFSKGLALAVADVVNQSANYSADVNGHEQVLTLAQQAKRWFVSSYPLMGALASSFAIIEEPTLCGRMQISVAAVHPELQEIYINPAAGLDAMQCRFVIAHELLHVGLNHHSRSQGRDPYFWNVACDYVINAWLMEMEIGHMPQSGALYDPELKGLSAESIYDRIVTDVRRMRKIATLRGVGLGDILERTPADGHNPDSGIDLDEFYRRCLGEGLVYHENHHRGFLPAGLMEEIRALSQPVIPWDVELAKWFDEHFLPIEKQRSYARPSRRQSSTPDIPRPRWILAHGALDGRTYGVILDTSGSMDRGLLAKALGTIASYSIARDVPLVRVVFCDATYYDQGYMQPEVIAESVKIRGRGGTVIQPAIEMLEKDESFPKDGPLLIITDGYCDRLRIHREHAFVLPQGRHLPFVARGKVFYIK
jgi:predicted metal-dependent peptidase